MKPRAGTELVRSRQDLGESAADRDQGKSEERGKLTNFDNINIRTKHFEFATTPFKIFLRVICVYFCFVI